MAGTTTIYSLNYPTSTDLVKDGATAIQTLAENIGTNVPPTASLLAYAGSTAPAGWLLCGGQAVSRTTYATLFGIIGTTYGAGDGSTTFNVPDLRGRVVAGVDNMGGAAANRLTNTTMSPNGTTRGATGGAQTHLLTGPESGIQQHNHVIPYAVAAGGGGGFTTGPFVGNANTQNTGPTNATSAHLNAQPTIILNYLIKT